MKSPKKWMPVVALLAFAAPACSGDDTTIGSPEATEAVDYSYTIDASGFIYDTEGQYFSPIPDEAGVAFDSTHPGNEDDGAMTLRDLANLAVGSEVCFHGLDGDRTSFFQLVRIFSTLDLSGTGATTIHEVTILEVTYTDLADAGWIKPAEELGLSPYPNGTWKEGSYVTAEPCS